MASLSRDGAARPSFLAADRITGRNDVEMTAEGDVELRRIGSVVGSDRLTYWHLEDEVEAIGNVRLEREQDQMTGPKMRLRMEDSVGYFEEPKYRITRSPIGGGDERDIADGLYPSPQRQPLTAHGAASRLDFEGENQYRLTNATYSTCGPSDSSPDWYAEVGEMRLDYDRERGDASDAKVVFKGVPILYSPWLSFSLNNQRKSGLLSPSFGSTSKSGVEYTQPVYWNIAPNMDATISPRLMAKRGIQWNTEFRYLDYNYTGQMRFEYLPDDRIENKRRSGYSIFHTQNFGYGFTGSLNMNGVSDDTYLTDMSTRLAVTSQTNLLREGRLNYGGGWWNASLMAQRYQTLQDPALPRVVKPYDRLPQFTVTANRPDLPGGLNFAFNGEYVNFSHASLVEGRRTTLYPQLSLPLEWASVQMTPKLGLHSTRYALDRQAVGMPSSINRNIPIFSLDSSVTLERDFDWFGRGLTQTLEPRVYYLYVPFKDQSVLNNATTPIVFDTALADFNFAQIFSENRYGGGDRIADANQVTAALTSRIIDPNTGSELVRGALGQRYYFTTQHVTLPGEIARTTRKADILAAVSGQVMPRTWVDTGWQYNPNLHRTERFNLGGRWQPEIGKVLNAGYRYNRNLAVGQPDVKQVDFSGQWPLGGGWYGVGRYNYSLQEKRLIESVGGLELEGNCWVARFVVQRIATATQKTNTAFFVQLELNGFSRLGSNPLDLLKRNIPGYGRINQPTADPVFAAD
ncbi:MAG: LPS-assembly protein LptD [Rhodocyclaceae bacterium]|nr:LPS-assembly protein LptD [Rhodocyclaceae bacterium]